MNSLCNIGEFIYDTVQNLVIEYKNLIRLQIEYKGYEYIEKLKKEIYINEIKNLINNELEPIYSNLLNIWKELSKNNNQIGFDFSQYDFNNNIKIDIDSIFDSEIDSIDTVLSQIKGEKYNVNDWEFMDYDDITYNKFDPITDDFNVFITTKETIEKNSFESFLKEIIRKIFDF